MTDLIDTIINFRWVIASSLIMVAIGAYLSGLNSRRNRFAVASASFRSVIFSELEGLYPVIHWDQNIFPKFRQSITKIESAAAKFKHFVPFYRKRAYDKALKNYCNCCNEITLESCAAYDTYTSTREPDDKGPRERFKHSVENLLSYAKEK